jgi:5-(carboxyamino)imidazole ribonucleotide synthase
VVSAERLARHVPVRPGIRALAVSQDRVAEKTFLRELGIETAPFAVVDDVSALESALNALGRAAVLKTRRFGYDGKGQVRIGPDDVPDQAFAAIGATPAILEGLVRFSREVSIIAARALDGRIACYDATENVHRNGILHTSTVPARIGSAAEQGRTSRRQS